MDFGLFILPPFASQRAGLYFGQRPIYPAIWNQARRKDRRKLTGLLKFVPDVRRDHQSPLATARPGRAVVD